MRDAGRLLLSVSVPLFLALAACAPAPRSSVPAPRAASCLADLDTVIAVVRADYAGYRDRAAGRERELAALGDSLRVALGAEEGVGACTRGVQRWLAAFGDPHLAVMGGREPGPPAPRRDPSTAPRGPRVDPRRPSLAFPDDSTAVLRLRSFELEHAVVIDSLVAANRARLLQTAYLVIDVRRNGGGLSGSYASLLPLLQTGPVRVYGWDTWSSPGNLAAMRAVLEYPGLPAAIARQIREVLPRMGAAPGSFVTLEEDHELRFDTVFPLPRAVAVLIDRWCASSCEQFVLDARQSERVTIMGSESTHGALVYGNVRTVRLPSGLRELSLPMARSHWARLHPAEMRGIAPDLLVPPAEGDLVSFARRHLPSLATLPRRP